MPKATNIRQFSAAYLHQRFDYNPTTGELRHNALPGDDRETRSWNTRYAGKNAGRLRQPRYVAIKIDGKSLYAHNIIWKMTFGEDPPAEIDHIDRDGYNNKLDNLRPASHSDNMCNQGMYTNNTSGVTGVRWHKHLCKWQAIIARNGRRYHLGAFTDKNDAITARRAAERVYHGEFAARGG